MFLLVKEHLGTAARMFLCTEDLFRFIPLAMGCLISGISKLHTNKWNKLHNNQLNKLHTNKWNKLHTNKWNKLHTNKCNKLHTNN